MLSGMSFGCTPLWPLGNSVSTILRRRLAEEGEKEWKEREKRKEGGKGEEGEKREKGRGRGRGREGGGGRKEGGEKGGKEGEEGV